MKFFPYDPSTFN